MSRFLCVPIVAALLTALPLALGSTSEQGGRIRELQRQRDFIHVLVQGGMRLAAEDDPLKRAECCTDMAEHMAGVIRKTAQEQEGLQTLELVQYQRDLLKNGVAGNLIHARRSIPQGSAQELELNLAGEKINDRLEKLTKIMSGQLKLSSATDQAHLENALNGVRGAVEDVDKALKSTEPEDKGGGAAKPAPVPKPAPPAPDKKSSLSTF